MELNGEYQLPVYQRIVNHFEMHSTALVVMATGLGKTVIAAFWAKSEYEKKRKGLFLCHDAGILDQAQIEFRAVIGSQISIKTFYGLDKDCDAGKGDVVFATFQMLRSLNPFFSDEFDYVIVDESHHGQAPTYREVIQYFAPKKLLGITATPDREDEYDIRDIFGDEVVNISLEEAIVNQWLCQVEYHILNDNLNHWKLKKIVRDVIEGKEKISIKQLNEMIFIATRDEEISKKIQVFAGNKKTIIFCENIIHTENFSKYLPNSAVYHSEKSGEFNRVTLQDFRNGKSQFILAVNKMNEGIDVPDAEMLVFLRCTDSKRIFYQQLGRGLRKFAGKKKIIVLDFVANFERISMIQQLAYEIKELSGERFDLVKRILNVSGKAFDFIFSDEQVDILNIVNKICSKSYISDIPHLLAEYSPKNSLPANQVLAGTRKKIWWKCLKCKHEWLVSGSNRVYCKTGCPACAGRIITENNNLAVTHPEMAKEYSPKNSLPINQVIAGTNKKLWWKCLKCKHEWLASGSNRVCCKSGCPACSGRIITENNNLAVTHPEMAKEYSPKNSLPVNQVIAGTGKKIWWKCLKCKHEWLASGSNRVCKKTGCPACAGRIITENNNLAVTHPEMDKEYSPKNALPANQVLAGTNKKLWWKCLKCKHEWLASGGKRVCCKTGCPACARSKKRIKK